MFSGCRIKNTCLIIITSLVILGLNGCSLSRSVRQGSRTSVKKQGTEQNSASRTQDEIRQDALPDAEPSEVSQSPDSSTRNVKLPTLQQQLKSLSEEQVAMKSTISVMQNDITGIKATLEDIKNALGNSIAKPQETLKGAVPENHNNPNIAESNIILPDEAIDNNNNFRQDVKKIDKPQVKSVTYQKKPVRKIYTPKIINYEKPIIKHEIRTISKEEPAIQTDENINYTNVEKDLNTKNYQDAIRKLNKLVAVEKDPEQINNYNFLLGESHFGLKQYEQAIAYYRKVIASRIPIKKDNAQIMLAEAQVKSGRLVEARKAYEVFVEKYPSSEFLPKARKMLQQL